MRRLSRTRRHQTRQPGRSSWTGRPASSGSGGESESMMNAAIFAWMFWWRRTRFYSPTTLAAARCVMSPDITSSRSSRLNSMTGCYVCRRAWQQRPARHPAGRACLAGWPRLLAIRPAPAQCGCRAVRPEGELRQHLRRRHRPIPEWLNGGDHRSPGRTNALEAAEECGCTQTPRCRPSTH
jgi:hypothetical protein